MTKFGLKLENEDGLSIATEAANISYKLIKKAIKSSKPFIKLFYSELILQNYHKPLYYLYHMVQQ
jgi:hypothetical protein